MHKYRLSPDEIYFIFFLLFRGRNSSLNGAEPKKKISGPKLGANKIETENNREYNENGTSDSRIPTTNTSSGGYFFHSSELQWTH